MLGIIRVLLFSTYMCASGIASAADVTVITEVELRAAIDGASAGDIIVLATGTYEVDGNLNCTAQGTASTPIVVRAQSLGSVVINFDAVEGFKVSGANWVFENLEIHGVCANDSSCEHAFHIVGNAEGTTVRNNRVEGFNAHIKGNGSGDGVSYPDDVVIEYNEFFSDAPRQTSNPVTPIDVVGGRRWIIRHNYIHDFQKAQGNGISYAAFLKGNSRDGVFSHNLVVCEALHQGGTRLGLSFGGGGTGPDSVCEEGTCTPEHQNGLMYNNIIANCPTDVGIYINEGANVRVFNNTLVNTTGIDLRFAATTAEVRNNLLDGQIRERDGATATSSNNVAQADLGSLVANAAELDFTLVDGSSFVDLGMVLDDVPDDFCRRPRDGAHDIGALEYGEGLCDTTTPFHREGLWPPHDGGPWFDAGVSGAADAGGNGGSGDGTDGGCGCDISDNQTPAGAGWLLLLFAAGILVLRRPRVSAVHAV